MTKYLFSSRKLATTATIQVGLMAAACFWLTSGIALVRSEVSGQDCAVPVVPQHMHSAAAVH